MIDTVFNILKVSAIVFICSVFLVAIYNLIAFITSLIFANVIGEFFSLISMYLPFNAGPVFAGIGLGVSAIFTFLIAKKIFDLTSWSISSV